MKAKIVLTILALVSLSGCTLPFFGSKPAALQVASNPIASVYINGNHVGQTPFYDENIKPGEHAVRILVEDDPTKDWQTKIILHPETVSSIYREFSSGNEESYNFIMQMEPVASKKMTEISVATTPENVIVKLDGSPQGFSPVTIQNIEEGEHSLTLTAPGYQDITIPIQARNGFRVVVTADMGKTPLGLFGTDDPTATESATLNNATDSADLEESESDITPTPRTSPSPTPRVSSTPAPQSGTSGALEPPYVTILETGTGWLRVRSEPNGLVDNEVARVDVGDSFPHKDTQSGWYQIEYEPGNLGWISAQFARLTQ